MFLKISPAYALAGALILSSIVGLSQTVPVGSLVLEETLRRKQLMGEIGIDYSFTIRPIQAGVGLDYDSLINPLANLVDANIKQKEESKTSKSKWRLMPLIIRQQFNTHHPYGWNDGSMIPSKGYQSVIAGGLFAEKGLLSIQIQPELVYAQNSSFSTFPSTHTDSVWYSYYSTTLNVIDAPERFGNKSYKKLLGGQSSIRLNLKKLSFGVSTENLWWGPGIRNALIMSNNAPGFPHLTLNTISPIITSIGTFEGQVISGLLKNSDILPPDTSRTFNGQRIYVPKKNDKRYLNGMVVTWQPRWTKGLHLGFTRVFYIYKSDIESSLNGYLPIIGSFFKGNTRNEDDKLRDQVLSVFARLILPKDHAEFYLEYGRNDHSQNLDDLLQEPEHSRAVLFGGKKIFTTTKNTNVELMAEFTTLQLPSTFLVREQNIWYVHHQVRHGYTNLGQVIGAGIGPGANSQTFAINWIKGIRRTGIMLERVVRNNDFFYNAFSQRKNFKNHWVDLSLNINKNWVYKGILFDANISLIKTLNYQWRNTDPNTENEGKTDFTNVLAQVSIFYQFK